MSALRRWQLLPLEACFEFVAHRAPPLDAGLPARPGQVARDAAGRARLVHFAPLRWLVPAPDDALAAQLAALERDGCGALVEVSGKWQRVALAAELARPVLASALDVDAVLEGREAAAVVLFDCPAILARSAAGYELWIAASYLHSLTSVIEPLRVPG